MITEEKAHKYDEALKIAQCWLNDPQTIQDCSYTIKDAIQNIFPQLKEGENERILQEIKRKEAIDKVYGMIGTAEQHEALDFLVPEVRELRESYDRQQEDEKIRKEIISALKFANDDGIYNKHIAYLEKVKEKSLIPDELVEGYKKCGLSKLIEGAKIINAINGCQNKKSNTDSNIFEEEFKTDLEVRLREQKKQKPAESRKRNKPKESWLSKAKYEIEHADELLIQRQEELREIRELKKKEQNPENKLEDAFKYYTDRGISISCGDIKAEPKKEQKHRKFKLGDKVHWYDDDTCVMTITGFRDDAYITDSAYGPILFCNEDDWKKVEQKSVELSDDELQKHQDELYDFKVFAAKQAKEYHISFVHDYEWNNFCAELLSYFNEKQKPFNICEQCPYYKDCPNYNEQKLVDNISKEEYVKRFKALCDAYEIKLPNREYDIYHLCDDLSKLSIDSDKQSLAEGDNETEIQKVFREGKSAGRKEVFDHPEEYGLHKEQKLMRDITPSDAIESCMLRYLQSAANRKDDTEIIEDTKTYKAELISIIKKEQKPVSINPNDKHMLERIMELVEFCNDKETIWNWLCEKVKEQKPVEKQDYSGLNDLERAIHRGFLSTGVENVPVTIIKETAKECLAQMKPAEWSEEDEEMRNLIVAIFEVNHPDGFFKANELGTTDMHGVRTEEIISLLKSLTLNLKKKNEDISKLCSNEWSDEDEGELQNAIDALEFLGKKGVYKSESGYNAALQAASWLKNITERFNLQPKEECSEVELEFRGEKVKIKRSFFRDDKGRGYSTTEQDEEVAWNALRAWCEKKGVSLYDLYPKEEWSEEDEEIFNNIIEKAKGGHWIEVNEITWLITRFKSLRPQYHGDVTMTEAYKMGKEAGEASHWELNEEDKQYFNNLISKIEKSIRTNRCYICSDDINRLKSKLNGNSCK